MFLNSLRSRFRAAPWGFLGMIVLIWAVEAGISIHEIDFRLAIEHLWRTQGREARGRAARSDVLCLGDSLIAQGVIPAVLEERLGRSTHNLGLGGGQFPAEYFLLRRILESGHKPSALVIDVLPLQLTIRGDERIPLWANFLETRELVEMAWVARDPDWFAEVFLARLFPSIRTRLQIRQAILGGLNGLPPSNRETNLAGERNLGFNQGALIVPPIGPFEVPERLHRWVYPQAITPNRLNGEYMERFLTLAELHEIPVFWLLTPVCSAIQTRAEQTGTDQNHDRFVREVQARYPMITIIDARHSAYPDISFGDAIHLNHPAAAVFTADLAEVIDRTLGHRANQPKWVQLPRYRNRSIEFRHEDLAESRKAVSPTSRR
jgi:hypothetical protein